VNLFGMIDQSGSAMQAERMRAEVVAANMANAETTRTSNGTPYRRSGAATGSLSGSGDIAPGVHIAAVVQDAAPPLKRYDPSHPDADAEGYVSYPDINPLTEMVDLMGATRAYGLNASAVQAEKSMISSALDISK